MKTQDAYRKTGGARIASAFTYNIEGKPYSMKQIIAELGVCARYARKRMEREKAKDGPVTWAGLKEP